MIIKNKNTKNIHFLLSNGNQLQMKGTNVFKSHLRAIQIIKRFNWNLEIIKIQVNKIWTKQQVKEILG